MAGKEQAKGFPSLDQVANIILVASGKGGVGKSTVAVNLASTLRRSGHKVGLLDADIYGPSIPTMLNLHKEVHSSDGKHISPNEVRGMKVMSMGFLIPPSKAMIWRGPMLHSAVTQFLRDVHWGALDYLVVDLPPGTGDVQLTFAQALSVTGAVIVSTPQEVALADVVRARAMFESVKIPVLGLIENMSYFVCDGCDKKHYIFAQEGARKAAEHFGIPFLAELPLEITVRQAGDLGMPIVESEPDAPISKVFASAAEAVMARAAEATEERRAREAAEAEAASGHRALPIVN
jgi:ATP-binding protein involved in chromosome partitioning